MNRTVPTMPTWLKKEEWTSLPFSNLLKCISRGCVSSLHDALDYWAGLQKISMRVVKVSMSVKFFCAGPLWTSLLCEVSDCIDK